MTKIDQFESVFKSATKVRYHYTPTEFQKILVVSDLEDDYQITLFGDRVQRFLRALEHTDLRWHDVKKDECKSIGDLLDVVEREEPDLVCTYRNLHSDGWKWSFSLGEYLDVLTQATEVPILVFPRPDRTELYDESIRGTGSVMAITDHLTGDDRLVDFAVRLTETDGTLYLSHVEDEKVFERYMDTTEKIREIETSIARETILAQLLKEPHDYITSCREEIQEHRISLQLKESISLGHTLSNYKSLIEEHKIDLLVLNTKDDDQLAMHGLAYPLAVELRDLPFLML